MSSTGSVTVVCRAAPPLQRQWYTGLATLIAAAPSPAAALFEASRGTPLRVTVRPAEVVETLRRSVVGRSVRIEPAAPVAPVPPRSLAHEQSGFLVRPDPSGPPPGEDDPRPVLDRVGLPAPAAETWLGLQTFWLPSRRGGLWVARRFRLAARTRAEVDRTSLAVGACIAAEWRRQTGLSATFRGLRFRHRREWSSGDSRALPAEAWFSCSPDHAARAADPAGGTGGSPSERAVETPAIVFGASGAGKSTYLARWGAHVVDRRGSLVVVDLHGDLAPAIFARLGPEARRRVVSVDASRLPVPGIAALDLAGPRDRAAAHLVAALKRLTPDGSDLYWGFRLERTFDTFVRVALESDGSLTDLYDLLTNPDRRDAARLATRAPELGRFLDELAPVVRRNPEFLWSAATRLSKVVLVPALRDLLAPADGGLAVESLLAEGRSLLVRLPFANLGPEAASFAATLVLGRVYLGIVSAAEERRRPLPVTVVLDEVHAFPPRLVAEMLTEGRKFGLATVAATQYPDRLVPEVRSAARGALRGYVAFRVPRAAAAEVGGWLGLRAEDAEELLPNLPTGEGLAVDPSSDGVQPVGGEGTLPSVTPADWENGVEATRREFDVPERSPEDAPDEEAATERVLLAVLSRAEAGIPARRADAVAAARDLPGDALDPALLAERLVSLERDGCLEEAAEVLRLTPAGERRLGLTVPTGAPRETAEHRALLMATFRLFARRGYRLEILRQGRFDTTLPDGRFRQLPDRRGDVPPFELAAAVERATGGWAWRFFRGRDVHVEVEVSGALRAERIRHGVQKALRRGAFALFVVGDARRARRVRGVLRSAGLAADRAQVWTIRVATPNPADSRGTNA